MMKLLVALLLLAPCAAMAQVGQTSVPGTTEHIAAGGCTGVCGPGDFSGSLAIYWYGIRTYSKAYATGTNAAIDVLANGTTYTLNILTTGNLDIATALTDSADTSGTGSINSGGTLTFTGGHNGDTVTGAGVLTGTFITGGSSGAWTVNNPQTIGPITMTLNYAMMITKFYDQTGNGLVTIPNTSPQAPELVFNGAATKAYVFWIGANNDSMGNVTNATIATSAFTIVANAERTSQYSSPQGILWQNNYDIGFEFLNTLGGNQIGCGNGTLVSTTETDGIPHAMACTINNTAAALIIDSATPVTATIASLGSGAGWYGWGSSYSCNCNPVYGYINEIGLWNGVLTGTQINNIESNTNTYYGTGAF
jgi:hypothetical protein